MSNVSTSITKLARHNMETCIFSSTFDIFDFFTTKCPAIVPDQVWCHTAFININPFLSGNGSYFFEIIRVIFFRFFGVGERLFLRVIWSFFSFL